MDDQELDALVGKLDAVYIGDENAMGCHRAAHAIRSIRNKLSHVLRQNERMVSNARAQGILEELDAPISSRRKSEKKLAQRIGNQREQLRAANRRAETAEAERDAARAQLATARADALREGYEDGIRGARDTVLSVQGSSGLIHAPTQRLIADILGGIADKCKKERAALLDTPAPDPDDTPCTCCGGTGWTIQTERRCACQPPIPAHRYQPSMDPNDQGECVICGSGPHTEVTPAPDPVAQAARERALAAVLWREQVVNSGAPESVAISRTPAAFANESEATQEKWIKYARAALRALAGEGKA
jgi:hypothetical protein